MSRPESFAHALSVVAGLVAGGIELQLLKYELTLGAVRRAGHDACLPMSALVAPGD